MHDLDGWTSITCDESNVRRRQIVTNKVGPGAVLSSLTDPEGRFGEGVIYTEWGRDGVPELRDYLWSDPARTCEHYVPDAPASSPLEGTQA